MNPPPAPFLELTTMRKVRRIFLAVAGATVLALGIALVVLPGPAFLVIPAGLAILAIEFAWARRWLRNARNFWPRATAAGKKYWNSKTELTRPPSLTLRRGGAGRWRRRSMLETR